MYIQDKPLICLSNDSNFFQTHGEAPRQIHSPKAYGAAIAAAGGIPMLTCEQMCIRDRVCIMRRCNKPLSGMIRWKKAGILR